MSSPQKRLCERRATLPPGSFCDDDGPEFVERALEILVEDHVVEERVVLDFSPRNREAPLHGLLRLAGAAPEPALELLHRRRQNERRNDVRDLGLDLPGTLVVDVEHHPSPPLHRAPPSYPR